VSVWIFFAAVLLSFERICYLWIWRSPDTFRAWCSHLAKGKPGIEPIDALQLLFWGFKILQCAVFIGWCFVFGGGSLWPANGNPFTLGVGAMLIAAGQTLNLSVFYRLGKVGVFYGNKFGYQVPWSHKFPFSCLKHPQYLGASLSIWGFFLVMRFPHDDWYLLPALETVYYSLGAFFER
jgi:methylene-fatty-acyl-phospholipid synthase